MSEECDGEDPVLVTLLENQDPTKSEAENLAHCLTVLGESVIPGPLSLWLVGTRYRELSRSERSSLLKREAVEQGMVGGPFTITYGFYGPTIPKFTLPDGTELESDSISNLLKFYVYAVDEGKFPRHTFLEEPELLNNGFGLLVERFTCYICIELCVGPVFGCINGHQLCNNCHGQMMVRPVHYPRLETNQLACPVCREAKHTSYRMTELENVISSSLFKCLHHNSVPPCDKVMFGKDFLTHVKSECVLRPWKCPFCADLLLLSTVTDHLLQHRVERLGYVKVDTENEDLASFCVRLPMRAHEIDIAFGLYYHLKWNKLFVLYQIRTGPNAYFWFVCIVGTDSEAQTYKADLSIDLQFDFGIYHKMENRKQEWKGVRVMSVQNDIGDMVEEIGVSNKDPNIPLHDFVYERSGFKIAQRVKGYLSVEINKPMEILETVANLSLN